MSTVVGSDPRRIRADTLNDCVVSTTGPAAARWAEPLSAAL
jgi:hypothetical protein